MSRDEYLHWRANVAISAKPTESIVELRNGRTFKISSSADARLRLGCHP